MKAHIVPKLSTEEQAVFERNKHDHAMRNLLADALANNLPLQVYSTTKKKWIDLKPIDGFNLKNKYRIKHKWQAEIDAYNSGEVIEYRDTSENLTSRFSTWKVVINPAWYTQEGAEYRVKPKPRTFFLYQFTSYPVCAPNLRLIVSQDEPTSSHIKEYGIRGTATFKRDELTYLHTVQINQG